MNEPVVVTALRSEWLAVRAGGVPAHRCGMGARRAARWATANRGAAPLTVLGVSGGLDPRLRATDVVVATAVVDSGGMVPLPLPAPDDVAAALRRAGLRVRLGPVLTSQDLFMGRSARRALRSTGALCVDMESAAIVAAAGERPVTVVRVVVDTARAGLLHPATVANGARALWTLRTIAATLRGADSRRS